MLEIMVEEEKLGRFSQKPVWWRGQLGMLVLEIAGQSLKNEDVGLVNKLLDGLQ
jgi:hypothetical protein